MIQHLSIELQQELTAIGSKVTLAKVIDGYLPSEYAFMQTEGRQFRAEFARAQTEFSTVLFESTDSHYYEHCFARGIIKGLNRLALLIHLWVEKNTDVESIAREFTELEFFKASTVTNNNPEIEAAWGKLENMHFNDSRFWENAEWNSRQEKMLLETKMRVEFHHWYPYGSHDALLFSRDKNMWESWKQRIYIEAPRNTAKGRYRVGVGDEAKPFDDVHAALDFFAKQLEEAEPRKWRVGLLNPDENFNNT